MIFLMEIPRRTIFFNNYIFMIRWLHDQRIEDESFHVKYVYSFYFSMITMVTVGKLIFYKI